MTELQIVCQNCGAKYRLPASFHSDKAKCKGCGATIDVAAQRGAAAAPPATAAPAEPAKAQPAAAKTQPATAKPAMAKAKPAESKEKEAETPHRAASHGASSHGAASRRAHAGKDKDGDEGKGHGHRRHGHEKPAKKGMSPMLIGGSLGGIAVIVVVLIFVLGGGDDPANTGNVANASGAGVNPAVAGNAVTPRVETPAVPSGDAAKAPDAAAAGAGEGAAKPADAATEKPAVKPAAKPAEAEIQTKADVFDPKTLEPLAYPETIPQARRDELEAMIGEIDGTGRKAAIRAKDQLKEIGWASLFGLVNKLRTFDYTTPEGTRDAFEINQLLTAICDGTNTGFKPAAGDELPLKDMNHNALTVKAWQRFVRQYPDDESFKAFKKKKDAKRKDG